MLGVSELFYAGLAQHEHLFQQGCSIYDLEHMAACSALGMIAQAHPNVPWAKLNCPCPIEAKECVMFALMEAAPRSLEALLSFIVMTPYIGQEADYNEDLFRRSRQHPALTHCQDSAAYIDVIKCPIGLLCFIISTMLSGTSQIYGKRIQGTLSTNVTTSIHFPGSRGGRYS